MVIQQTHRLSTAAFGLLVLICASGGYAQSINSTWICENGNYSDTTCWEPLLSLPPCNSGPIIFNVSIPAEKGTISMDVNICEVNSLTLGQNTTFEVLADNSFSVIDQTNIYGIIHGNGGNFIAPTASFFGNSSQVFVDSGAVVEIGASNYSATDLNRSRTNYTLLSSDGTGSVLDLSTMVELNDAVNIQFDGETYRHTIVAQNGGTIDLSNLKKIIGPSGDEVLNIKVASDSTIILDSLESVSHADTRGRIRFNVDGNAILELPSLTSVSDTTFHVTEGAQINTTNSPFTYAATNLNMTRTNYTLLSSDGAGSVLNLSTMVELNDAVNILFDGETHRHNIIAQNGGMIDLSNLKKIIGPSGDEVLNIEIDNGTIDMSSLQTTTGSIGSISFYVNNGGTLILGDVTAEIDTSITLNEPNDLIIVSSDLNLGTMLTISNPGDAMLALDGDFTYSHTDETKIPFSNSYVFFKGEGPQELEVGGFDIGEFADSLENDNFGFGRMVIGESNKPSAVLLVDYINNGNRGGINSNAEALYLFGKDGEDGLQIRKYSILYMGGLQVYAMLDGVITDLTTLFEPDEVIIPFDEGWLCLDRPDVGDRRNLIKNGCFETGDNLPMVDNPVVMLPAGVNDLYNWQIGEETINWNHESIAVDSPFHDGQRYAEISSIETGNGAVSQEIPTEPGTMYHVWFDMAVDPSVDVGTTALRVSAADSSEEFPATGAGWQTKTWRFVANEDTTTLTFEGIYEPNTPFSVNIDNVIVLSKDPNNIKPYDHLIVQITDIENPDCLSTQLTITVTDANLTAVTSLDASNFSIFVDGELQTPVSVKLNTTPISVCLVLDYSGSMSDDAIEAMEEAAEIFVRNMYDDDYGEILKFSVEIEVMQAFTGDKDALIDAIVERPDFPRVETSLYDAIYQAISDTTEQTGNKAVIAMSDGDDNKSQKNASDVIEHAVQNEVPVFAIGLGRKIDANDLRIIAEQTSGVYYESPTPDDLAAIYQALSVILKNQYQVTLETTVCDPNNIDTEHELEIIVNLDTAYGQDSEIFSCPPECNPDTDSDDSTDGN
jgi:uncharacterized protein YegL